MNDKPYIIDLPKIEGERGNLSVIEESGTIPFKIQRSYWIYDVPGGKCRHGRALRHQAEFIVALSGSFDVHLDTGSEQFHFHLNRSYFGVYVPPMIWRTIDNFSTNSVVLVVTDGDYSAKEYIEDHADFIAEKQCTK